MPVPFIPIALAAASIGKGIFDAAQGNKQMRRAEQLHAQIPEQDPGVSGALANVRQMRKYVESGMTRMNAYSNRQINNSTGQAMANQRRLAGASPGAAQQGMLRAQATGQNALMGVGARNEQMAGQLLGMETPLVSDMADRSLSLRTYLRDLNQFRGATRTQQGNNMFTGAMGIIAGVDPKAWRRPGTPGAPGASQPVGMPATSYTPVLNQSTYEGTPVPGLESVGTTPFWMTNG